MRYCNVNLSADVRSVTPPPISQLCTTFPYLVFNPTLRYCAIFRGYGGGTLGSWGQIMENEFECLTDRRGLGGHFSEEFVKQNYSWPEQSHFP